jgi:predicted enzyme related to lactoylglutathione lyase
VPGALDRRRTAGGVGWHELHAGDWKPAFQFYAGLFGWTAGEQHDLGKMGLYQLFARETEMIGGMMTKSASIPRPFWLFYFAVPSIEPAIIRMRQAGGEVLNGPHQVPGGSWIAQCVDPQGGLFALAAPSSGSG